jgi:hypothetical protein
MRARGSKSGVKNETAKSPETREYLGKIGIFLLLNSGFPHTKFDFLQQLSDFQEIRENLLQQLHHTVLQVLKTCMLKWLSTKPIFTLPLKIVF